MASDLLVCHLGTLPYRDGVALQEQVRARVQDGELEDTLLLLEHEPVYTRGRRSAPGELAMGEDWYRAQGIDVVQTNRGGKVTYHGPGQLVGYPIVHVGDVVEHVRAMESALVSALGDEGLEDVHARPDDGPEYAGVWVGERKIASVGVHVSRGVAMHGFAVNVTNDLQPFGWVIACGLPDVQMTSVTRELGRQADLRCFRRRVAYAVAQALGRRQRLVAVDRLASTVSV